jgi:branched-chain amino acid transport system permease protein
MPEGTDILNALVLMTNFVFVPALAYGSQLALGALGVTLVFGILRFANFAHGDLMAFGTTITILFTWALQANGITFGVLPTALLALVPAIVVTAIAAILIDKAVFSFYRKQKAAPVVLVIASVGVMFMLSAIVRFIMGTEDRALHRRRTLRGARARLQEMERPRRGAGDPDDAGDHRRRH